MKKNHIQENIAKPLEVKKHHHVVQLILAAANHNPEHLAICTSEQQYCYQNLMAYVESAIEDLIKNGAIKGDVVGLHGKCSFEFIGYFLACLSLGVISVFIDEHLPDARKTLMLKNAKTKFVIDFSNEGRELYENEIKPTASVCENKNSTLQERISKIRFEDPAYIFFTSGSTGTPKGVVGCHGGLNHFVNWQSAEFKIGPQDKVAQITSLSFDVVLREILLPLVSGGTLWIPLPSESLYPKRILAWIIEKQITVVHTVPTMLRTWLFAVKQTGSLNKLRYLFSAGEPLLATVVESWRLHFGLHTEIINLYGPTETTLAKCYYRLPTKLSDGVQPIGQPMNGAEVFIMKSDQSLCQHGETGEIVIRTPYRSLGYLDSNQTKRAFKKNKYSSNDSDLLYFTGDLGFIDNMNQLRILGRKDNQVKVNGVRIELGEIEKRLYEHNNVLHAVALLHEKEEIKTLIAVVSLKQLTTTGELVQHLQTLLPQTHMPSRIIIIESIPLTASGKVSKSELLKLLEKENIATTSFTSFEHFSEVDQKIHKIWKSVIGVDEFGLDDHIMSLGCSSIQAISIANLLYDEFGISINYKTLMDFPTVKLLAQYVTSNSTAVSKKNALETSSMSSNNESEDYPLSASQKRFWLMHKNEFIPSQLYNVYAVFRLVGNLDVTKLKKSVDTLVHRHRILQFVIKENNFEPRQCLGTLSPHLEIVYLASAQNAKTLIQEHLSIPMDLECGPLTKFYLFIAHDNTMTFVINQHHIITDDLSLTNLLAELSDIYNGVEDYNGKYNQDFLDYIAHERHQLSDDEDSRLAYWQKHLAEHVDIRLPSEYLRPPIFNYQGKQLIYRLDEAITENVNTLAKQLRCSEFTVLFSAFYILLNKYSGQNDFVIGLPVSNRPSSTWEAAVGCFINMLAIKPNFNSAASLQDLLKTINMDVINGYANQACSFDKIIDSLNIQHDSSQTSLYQVIFNMQPRHISSALHLGDINSTQLDVENNTTKTDITWAIKKDELGYYLCIDYASSLFSERSIKLLAKSYETLLKNFNENLTHPIGKLSLLSQEEKNAYFSEVENTAHSYQKSYEYLYSPFEEQAQQDPEAMAIKAADGMFRYGELLTASKSLAVALQQQGVKPNELIAIYLPKSKYQVVATLGIMMSGGAYLPVSSEEASDRFAQILRQGEVNIVITSKALRKAIPDSYTVIEIDDENSWSGRDPAILQVNHHSNDLAYVIFTSGSTGTPKGVMIEHRAALNTIQDINERYSIDKHDQVYGLSSLNFDLSVYDLFGTLGAGACLVLPRSEDCKEPSAWVKAIKADGITVWNTVPALMQMLIDYAKSMQMKSDLSRISLVLMSGDWIPLNLAEEIWRTCGSDTEVVSLGGATEASIWSILHAIKFISPDWKSIPYGRPMWNQQFYILNQQLDPVPPGVIGELCIGGVGLARGYWKDQDKTDASFVAHPQTGQRLYRTGDLGRYHDGVIEFLGRVDHQVKIRGYRIELGEIEAQLDRCEGVERSAVIERNGKLFAYVKGAYPLHVKTLRTFLSNKLPAYMLPDMFHQIENFTLTNNGKVDLKALPDVFVTEADSTYEAPINEAEKLVAQIWASVLDKSGISRHDNFFSLGGHSLKALEVVLLLKNKLNREINLKDLFTHPVLSEFAKILTDVSGCEVSKRSSSLKIQKFSYQNDYPLSHTQARLWFIEKMVPGNHVYTVSALYEIEGEFDHIHLNHALSLLTEEQSMLRAVMIDEGSGKQKILSEFYPEIVLIDWTSKTQFESNSNDLQQFVESIAQKGFKLCDEPLWKVYQIKISDLKSYLLFSFHHLIIDGVSLDLFMRSLAEKYNALLTQREVETNLLPFDYLDYAQSLALPKNQASIQEHLIYWKNKLAGFENYRLNLPTEKQRPEQFSFKGCNIEFQIAGSEKIKLIDQLAKQMNCTRSVIFLGLYHLLLFYLSGQSEILTGQMLANRNQSSMSGVIGYFANTLVAKSSIQSLQHFADYIQQLQRELLDDFSHQEIPFELLVDALSPVIDSSASPIFQHMFVYQQLEERNLGLNGIKSKRLQHDSESAKFDLTFFVEDMGNTINGKFEYYSEIFSEKNVDGFIKGLEVLLDTILNNWQVKLSDLNIINLEDKNKLERWNTTAHCFIKKYDYLYSPFEEQAALTPLNIAIDASDGSYCYGELLSASQSLAFKLQNLGAQPNKLIAIYLPKSKYQVVATLGVMMSGAAYLPISSEEAPERLAQILNQGEVDIILTCDELIALINGTGRTIINLNDEANWFDKYHGALSVRHKTTDLAYVIFTSGSTGIPKGVMIEHQAALNTIQDINERYQITALDKVYGLSSLNFDLSVYDLFGTLAVGGTLVLPNNADYKEPSIWIKAIQEKGITIWNTVPALAQMLVDYANALDELCVLNVIRLVLMSGDWIPLSLPGVIRKTCGDETKIISLGGATEASIWSILYPIEKISSDWKSIPYGRPMWNQQFYILNQHLDLVPQGVVGELCIGGVGLARGYWKDQDKTDASFVVHPQTGERLYRTGDLGRYQSDGVIEFLGRVDHQVKIRGYRIELGEIEAQLDRCEGVERSVVIERDGKLFAYVIANTKLNEVDVIETLKGRVSHYMVPVALMQLSKFPLSINGKIDRKQLPQINLASNQNIYQAPKGEIENIVAEVWSKELEITNISRMENFFALGGSSLKAVSVVNLLRVRLGYAPPLKLLFSTETLAEFANQINLMTQQSIQIGMEVGEL